MVDLVKIRKKAKEKKEAQPAPEADAQSFRESAPAEKGESAPPPSPPAAAVASSEPPVQPASIEPVAAAQEHVARPTAEPSEKLERFRRTAGVRLIDEASAEEQSAENDLLELLLFAVGGEHYAAPIEKIVEIIPPRSVTQIPNSGSAIVGIISLRGTVVTILDIRQKLGHGTEYSETDDTRVIVFDYRAETCGFVVDRVSRVIRVPRAEVENHPVVTTSEQSEFIRGVFQHSNRVSVLLDVDRLLHF